MDDAGPPSLFVVAYHGRMDPPYFSILQLESPHETPELQIKKIKADEKRYVIRFNQEPRPRDSPSIRWLFSPPTSSTEDLYMVPNWGFAGRAQTVKPLQGYKFNLGAGICEPITPPLSSEQEGRVVNLGGRIYLLGYDLDRDKSLFQCYDPDKKSWKCLEPFPHRIAFILPIVATAVLGNYILFNLNYCQIWAYDVIKNKWYEVGVEDERCYLFEGEAVVVGDTIYALTDESFGVVVGLSIEKKPNDGDLLLQISSKNLLPDIIPINCEDAVDQKTWRRTRHLVHLGKDNFCIAQSCNLFDFNGFQNIKLTYVKLKGKNSVIVAECVYEVKFQPTGQVDEQFDVLLCFAMPKGATTALKEGKIFNLEPFPEAVQEEEDEDNDSKLAKIIAEHIGRSVNVRELPAKVTLRELEMGLKKFGPIVRYGMQARKIGEAKHNAYVEFESATSKQLAIEASPIMIGDCPVILEQRLTEHTLGVFNRTLRVGSSSFGKNKLKNRGEGSRSKTTCAGHTGGGGIYLPGPSNKGADLESQFYGFENDLKEVKEKLENDMKEKERVENDLNKVREQLVNYLKKEKERLENYLKEKEQVENDLKKVNEWLDFLAEERNKALQDAEESNKQVMEMSSKLEEEAIDSKDEKKQALDLPKSKGTAVLEEDHARRTTLIVDNGECSCCDDIQRRLTVRSDQWRKVAEAYADILLSTGNNGKLMDRSVLTGSKYESELEELKIQIRRVTVESGQWRKVAEAYADILLSTGKNGKLMDRSVLTGSKYGPRSRGNALPYSDDGDDDSIRKKNRNVLKRLKEILWKKPHKKKIQKKELEAELRRVTVESGQWRKVAEACADILLSTGNNGKLMDRSVLTGSKYGPRSRGSVFCLLAPIVARSWHWIASVFV